MPIRGVEDGRKAARRDASRGYIRATPECVLTSSHRHISAG